MNKQLKTQLTIIAMFAVMIFASFIPEMCPTFFGDYYCMSKHGDFPHTAPTWHWGFRHWAYVTMGAFLFIYNLCNLIDND
jgi:hypothetical protein